MKTTPEQAMPIDKRELRELNDAQLDGVAGGDLHFTKVVDKPSPNLFASCCSGKAIH